MPGNTKAYLSIAAVAVGAADPSTADETKTFGQEAERLASSASPVPQELLRLSRPILVMLRRMIDLRRCECETAAYDQEVRPASRPDM